MNVITTIYRGPTSRRGAQIEARVDDGAPTIVRYPYRHELSAEGNHEEAALAFARHIGETAFLVGGAILGGGIRYWVPLVEGVTRTVDPRHGCCAWPPSGCCYSA
jgi:hypothetical protein